MTDAVPSRAPSFHAPQTALREELSHLLDVVGPVGVIDLLLERAFQLHATDIHFDPTDRGLRLRLRVDGLLHDVLALPPEATQQIVSRIKLMGGMDITERRLCQDGHISTTILEHQRDIRVASGPTVHGERLVLRLMPDDTSLRRLEDLGMDESQIESLGQQVKSSHGMVLSVGPVGSGKSTTVYSCIERLNAPSRSLVTIEDPVERRIAGINQVQIDPRIEFGFVDALRGVLRQDPDVMMVGEIRDPETAHIACQAALTGVLVLSTLHATDAAGATDVFREYGISRMFTADCLRGIVAQRLVRRVCPACRTPHPPDAAACEVLGIPPSEADGVELFRGAGCDACFQTGYFGRTGVFEVMEVDTEVREAILKAKHHAELKAVAVARGMQTLVASLRKKVREGITTVEEMHRVLAGVSA